MGFSGAKLETMLNEAALRAARRDSGPITAQDVDGAFRDAVGGRGTVGLHLWRCMSAR